MTIVTLTLCSCSASTGWWELGATWPRRRSRVLLIIFQDEYPATSLSSLTRVVESLAPAPRPGHPQWHGWVEECWYHDAQTRLAETRQVKADFSSEYTNIDYQIRPNNPTSCTRPHLRPSLLSPSAIKNRKIKTTSTFRGDGDTFQVSKKMQRCPKQQTKRAHEAKEKCTRGANRISVILLRTFLLRVQEKVWQRRRRGGCQEGPSRLLLHRQGGGAP